METTLESLSKALEKIDREMVQAELDFSLLLEKVHPSNLKNAKNLLHYLALRSMDIRGLQDELHANGLSSMASSEGHIRGQLIAIQQRLGKTYEIPEDVFSYQSGKQSLLQKSTAIFGKKIRETIPYIMVTLDTDCAEDYGKVKNLLQSGMNVARINCAHDDESTWFRMVQHIRRAIKKTGIDCRIYMDLAGPKIRTALKGGHKFRVKEGMSFFLTDEQSLDGQENMVGCTVPGIAEMLHAGETVLIDDGMIEARVVEIMPGKANLQVMRISSKKPFIKDEKGINFPDSTLVMPALTKFDKECIPFILTHADIVGYSFVKNHKDILHLQEILKRKRKIPVILKIETPEAVKNLPDLLLYGLQEENIGVMIARGDLAVEIGFERMSEIQEEILWICEAAHVPVVWATQVLENLNKSGIATRSEITDAAHAAMADCVMINKGTHIIQTLETLQDIMTRTGGHHVKKRYTFRPLAIASRYMIREQLYGLVFTDR